MPELSRFFGIVIAMNTNDHNPPHFHVRYQEWHASIRIDDFGLEEGDLPSKEFGRVMEWAKLHQRELRECWRNVEQKQPLTKIKPLER